jgi:hypothetical protein
MSEIILNEAVANKPKAYVITPRDVHILKVLSKYRYLTTNDLKRLCFAANKNTLRTQQRLKLLTDVGLVDRMMQFHDDGRRKAFCFFLSEFGYTYLQENGHDVPSYVSKRAGKVKYVFLQHTLDVVSFWITLELSLQRITDVEIVLTFIPDFEIRQDALLKESKQSIRTKDRELYQEVIAPHSKHKFVVYPDALFTLTAKHGDEEQTKMFALEIDRGSETLETIRQKIIAYDLALKQGKLKKYGDVNDKNFAVLVQTNSAKRASNLREGLIGTSGEHLVWITSVQEVTDDSLLLKPIWTDARGKRKAILG